jgi:excisionase family DNA binding protein
MKELKFISLDDSELLNLIKTGVREALKEMQINSPAPPDEWCDLVSAAKYLMIAEQTLYSYTSQRKISFQKKGKKLYFRLSDLNKWLESGRQKTVDEIASDAQSFTSKGSRK